MKNLGLILSLLLISNISFAKQLRVAVIDSGIDYTHPHLKSHICTSGHINFTNEKDIDYVGHGTHVSGSIVDNAKDSDYCILSFKYFGLKQNAKKNSENFLAALTAASLTADIVNISGGGPHFDDTEYNIIKKNPNTKFIVASGNNGEDLDSSDNKYYPACYKLSNIIVVGSINKKREKSETSNYGSIVKNWEIGEEVLSTMPNGNYGTMSGTSMSAAIHTGKVIYAITH